MSPSGGGSWLRKSPMDQPLAAVSVLPGINNAGLEALSVCQVHVGFLFEQQVRLLGLRDS